MEDGKRSWYALRCLNNDDVQEIRHGCIWAHSAFPFGHIGELAHVHREQAHRPRLDQGDLRLVIRKLDGGDLYALGLVGALRLSEDGGGEVRLQLLVAVVDAQLLERVER